MRPAKYAITIAVIVHSLSCVSTHIEMDVQINEDENNGAHLKRETFFKKCKKYGEMKYEREYNNDAHVRECV